MKKIAIFISLMATFFVFASFVDAQDYIPLAPLPLSDNGDLLTTYTLSSYLGGMLKLLIALGAGLSILVAIIGGTQYVAAGIAPSAKQDAKERIWNALIGLTLILTSYLILNSINPGLVNFDFSLPNIVVAPGVVNTNIIIGGTTTGTNTNPAPFLGGATPANSAPMPVVINDVVSPGVSDPIINSTPVSSVGVPEVNLGAIVQSTFNSYIDLNNDYSIITHCFNNTTEPLCNGTDLNSDGKTDTADVTIFRTKGSAFNANQNTTLELADLTTPTSCFFKTSTVNIRSILPRRQSADAEPSACGSIGKTLLPTVACNGATWIKAQYLSSACAPEATIFNSVPYYSSGPYDKFKSLITDASSGSAVNLTILFKNAFFESSVNDENTTTTFTYSETDVGKITYATIAQYDLNDDGFADFGAGGADISAFNTCKGGAVSGLCAQADFNGDGTIDDRDIAVGGTTQHPVVGSVVELVRNRLGVNGPQISSSWTIGDFESYFFDVTGYSDKQIINYWMGRKAVYGSRIGDLNSDRVVNSLDIAVFNDVNTGAPRLDFNKDGVVNLQI